MQRLCVSPFTNKKHLCAIAGKEDEGPEHPTQEDSFCSRETATNSCCFLSRQPADLQPMLLDVPLPPLWLQELHNCHLLPEQPQCSRKETKNRPIDTKEQSIQQVIVHIYNPGAFIQVSDFTQVIPNLPCCTKTNAFSTLSCSLPVDPSLHHSLATSPLPDLQ